MADAGGGTRLAAAAVNWARGTGHWESGKGRFLDMSRFTSSGRFIYATAKSRDRAEAILEDMFATGDVFQSEDPRIEQLKDHRGKVKGYAVTLPA